MLKKWETLPEYMQNDEVRFYYDSLQKKKVSMFLKRVMDLVGGLILLILLAIPMIIISIMIKLDSEGPVFYRQERVTTYGKHFKIHKFRTMVSNADKIGSTVTVGTRPEAVKYVEQYKPKYMATLLLPAGITSEASIRYKDEAELLDAASDVDKTYIEEVLPGKMKYNLDSIKNFSFFGDIATMFRTVLAVLGKDYE